MKAVLAIAALTCNEATTVETFTQAGTITFEAAPLLKATAEMATRATLANRLGVAVETITATATESRRLESNGVMDTIFSTLRSTMGAPRRLAGKWSVAVEIVVPKADEESFKATAKLLQNDVVRHALFTDVMRPELEKLNAYDAAQSFTIKSVAFDGINTVAQDEAEAAAAALAAAAAEEATDGAQASSCNLFVVLAAFALAFGVTKQTA